MNSIGCKIGRGTATAVKRMTKMTLVHCEFPGCDREVCGKFPKLNTEGESLFVCTEHFGGLNLVVEHDQILTLGERLLNLPIVKE